MTRRPISQTVAIVPEMTAWQPVAASQSAQLLGATGQSGDLLDKLLCVVATAATAQVQIQDGASGTPITVLPNSPGGGIGTYDLLLGIQSKAGGWYVTTGAGVTVLAVGQFT
jgi:hypothetical protein